MEAQNRGMNVLVLARVSLILLSTALALALTLGIVVAWPAANFDTSFKTGPTFAVMNQEITYTIVAENTGALALNVVLSDALPNGTIFVPGSCTYRRPAGVPQTCGPLSQMWQEDFDTGDTITTTFAVTVTGGSMQWSLENYAYLIQQGERIALFFATVVNPRGLYLPMLARNYRAP